MKKKNLALFLTFTAIVPIFAKISFENPNINGNDEIVYTVNYDVAGSHSYRSIFHAKLTQETSSTTKKTLTYYPEQMELLSLMGQKVIQIRNRYGIARYYTATNSISWIKETDEIPLVSETVAPYAASADGKWICYIEKTKIASGKLVLESVSTGKKIELAEDILCSYDKVPVKWSPTDSTLVYEKNGTIYFCSPDAIQRGVEVEEKYRKIGRGTINSITWASEKYLVYIDDCIAYKINARELYTLGLYADIIGRGTAIGRLPFQFNANHDEFSANANLTGIVVAQEKKNFFYFKPLSSSADYMELVYSKLYNDSKASLADYSVFWNNEGFPIVWQLKLPYDSADVHGTAILFAEKAETILETDNAGKPVISPDNSKIAFFSGDSIIVYDINSWKNIGQISGEKIVQALWLSDSTIVLGGSEKIRKWDVLKNTTELIALSSAKSAFWNNSAIIAETSNGEFYSYVGKSGKWIASEKIESQSTPQNKKFRAFCGTTVNPYFENALFIRNLSKKSVTKPLYTISTQKMSEKPKVALIFDAYDNADGLPKIISTLKKFEIPGTFFINGEFIRRYPSQTKQIALNGYECASMFFSTTNLMDKSFVIDSDFIIRGLGRNEDEFYQCTGKELSLYWHAPYYNSSPEIIQAGNDAGYEYVNSNHIHSDNALSNKFSGSKAYSNPEKLIEEYVTLMKGTKGGIIPITVGISQGGDSQNLWESIDLLISALLDANFELVTVSEL